MRTDWVMVILLFLAGLLAAGQFAKVALTLDALAVQYPAAGRVLPFAVSMVSLVGLVFGTTAGALVARLGVRRVLIGALSAGAVLSLVQGLLPAFPVFMGLRAVEGAAHLALVVAAPTLMAAVSASRDRPLAMGLWGTFFGVGFAIAAALIPSVLASWGLAGVFAGHGLLMAALVLVLAPRLPRGVARSGGAEPQGWWSVHRQIYGTPRLVAPAAGFFWHTLTFIALLTFLPHWLGPLAGTLLPLVALVGTFGAGTLARRIAPHRIAIASFAASAVALPVLPILPEAWQLWYALPVFVLIGAVPGASFAAVPHLNHDAADQARANGAIAQLGNLGTATSTPLFALTLGAGLAGPVWLAAALFLCGIAALTLIHRNITETG